MIGSETKRHIWTGQPGTLFAGIQLSVTGPYDHAVAFVCQRYPGISRRDLENPKLFILQILESGSQN